MSAQSARGSPLAARHVENVAVQLEAPINCSDRGAVGPVACPSPRDDTSRRFDAEGASTPKMEFDDVEVGVQRVGREQALFSREAIVTFPMPQIAYTRMLRQGSFEAGDVPVVRHGFFVNVLSAAGECSSTNQGEREPHPISISWQLMIAK